MLSYYRIMTAEEKYLCCIDCHNDLKKTGEYLVCTNCQRKYKFSGGIFDCLDEMEKEKTFSLKKWDKFYKNWFGKKNITAEYEKARDMYQVYGANQIKKYYDFNKNTIYFELGCGTFIIGCLIAKDCKLVIGIDFSLTALKVARKIMDNKGIRNYLLIRGDIFKIPLKKDVVDILYGGGVIEHFKDTDGCVKEFARVMKKGGIALNAVPYLNIGALTYRQIWGNIPDFPVLKQMAEWVHLKLFKGKHMHFGYELSFTQSKLRRLHQKYGFKGIKFVRLESEVMMGFLPNFIRPLAIYLAENSSWFWPMMLVVSKK